MIFMKLKDDRSEKVRYDYNDYPIYIRKGQLSSYPNYAAPVHWHDDIELIAVLSGEMQYNVNGEVIVLKENEGIIVNARQLHFGFSEKRKECDFICILLHPLMLCTTSAYERDFVLPVLHNRNAAFVKLNNEIIWQKEILEDIAHMYSVKDEKSAPIKVQTLFLNIWVWLYENITHENRPEMYNDWVCDFVGFISE